MHPIIIIGSGLAGYMLAKEFRKIDTQTPLMIITASDGRFYSKPLLSTALTSGKEPAALAVANAEDMAQQLSATILTKSWVTHIDVAQQKVHIGDQTYTYKELVLAMGADINKPNLQGSAAQEIHFVNDLEDYTRFRHRIHEKQHIAIIGSGLIGCEFANDLVNVGHQVSIIAPNKLPLTHLVPDAIAKVLYDAFADEGIQWHLEKNITAVGHLDDGYEIQLDNEEKVKADVVLAATGLRPHVKLAHDAGIKVNRGMVVDRHLQTSVPHIYALGDCAEVNGLVLLFVAPLLNCARALAKTLTGAATMVDYPAMPVVIKTPSCPIAVIPPPANIKGSWEVSGEGKDWQALFYDEQKQLHGFALTGKQVNQRIQLAKQLPPMLN